MSQPPQPGPWCTENFSNYYSKTTDRREITILTSGPSRGWGWGQRRQGKEAKSHPGHQGPVKTQLVVRRAIWAERCWATATEAAQAPEMTLEKHSRALLPPHPQLGSSCNHPSPSQLPGAPWSDNNNDRDEDGAPSNKNTISTCVQDANCLRTTPANHHPMRRCLCFLPVTQVVFKSLNTLDGKWMGGESSWRM